MSFQQFCDSAKDIDQQSVTTNDSFVISFSKPDGSAFSIDPEDIVEFLKILSANHQECKESIENEPKFSADKTYLNYQEKPYRALYKLVGEKGLKTISSLGGSQTKELTKVITKLLTYVAGFEYKKVEENTYFDKTSVDAAISKMPQNLRVLGSVGEHAILSNKALFIKWLKEKDLSDRTVQSYSETCISEADKLLNANNIVSGSLYEISSSSKLSVAQDWLDKNSTWEYKNKSGNGMYSAGVKKYLEFFSERPSFTCLPKPFLLLAGISGTGKTRFVSQQASAFGPDTINYCLVSVRPDWHEPSDLLGYVSRLSGAPQYVSTKVLDFIIKAWKVAAPEATADGAGDLDLTAIPYWLCLDEMNLAPVEQYFADYLSVLESREFRGDKYYCEPLLDKTLLQDLNNGKGNIKSDLGLDNDDSLWQYYLNHGISIPPNLIVAGTVNMDETTHGFSRKVIDRAFTFDFGEFFPNDYDSFFQPETIPKTFSYSLLTQATQSDLSDTYDFDGEKTVTFLKTVNEVLKQTPFELAYRALNELLLQVACFKPDSEPQLQAVWDDFLMAKVLPRIDGDEDKLRFKTDDDTVTNLLEALSDVLSKQLNTIWDETRLDFYRQKLDGSEVGGISCRSKAKLAWMKNRLDTNTFTSFWP